MAKKEAKLDGQNMYPPLEGPMNMLGMYPVDPMGSYTGRPADPEDKPVQDADDL